MKIFWFVFAIAFATMLGLLFITDPGYLYFNYATWHIEMPLWLAMGLLICGLVVIWLVPFITQDLSHFFQKMKTRQQSHLVNASAALTTDALLALSINDWQQAAELALEGSEHSPYPCINYLAAAQAANEQLDFSKRETMFRLANQYTKSVVPLTLLHAKMALQKGQQTHCLEILKKLKHWRKKVPKILELESQAHAQLQNWQAVQELLPQMAKCESLAAKLPEYSLSVYQQCLQKAGQQHEEKKLQQAWRQIPKQARRMPELVDCYAAELMKIGAMHTAEQLLRNLLNKQWEPKLLQRYGHLELQSLKAVQQAEKWLTTHPEDAQLLATLGQLCVFHELYAKARDYMQLAIKELPTAAGYAQLAEIYQALGEHEQSQLCYQQGLLIVTRADGH